jgi:hypothetical protein
MRFYESPSWRLRFPVLDIRKIPRPERTGILAVLLTYSALCIYFDAANLKYMTGEGFSFYCYLFPWACGGPPPEDSWREIKKHYHSVLLVNVPGKSTKTICTCHFDLHLSGKPVSHYHFSQEEQACDSDWDYAEPREWTPAPPNSHFWYPGGPHIVLTPVDLFRWHCE